MNKPKSAKKKGYPPWIRTKIHVGPNRKEVHRLLQENSLHTVCQSARCPNIADCWHRRTATFMILGNRCTRNCRFCSVDHGVAPPPDPEEPVNLARTISEMKLSFAVITSVDRDDLADLGAGHWARCLEVIHEQCPDTGVEVLVPDFQGRRSLIEQVIQARPVVFGHNLETSERLSRSIRSGNRYDRSLEVLRIAREIAPPSILVKSGFMLGLGETEAEIRQMIHDLYEAGVQLLTIGQYLQPGPEQIPVARFVTPEEFAQWQEYALDVGFLGVCSSPMVRSSYKAEELARQALGYEERSWQNWA
ncbi:MAG: lipoyl synthase [Lentisphaerae bacterium]|nr:MAG: lipoyl synthase [Lentisphaerota bacterium]